jgi:pimeloyl-ACP methyl ester carboxylesterase
MNDLKDDMRGPLLAWTGLTERVLPLAGVTTAVLEGGDGPPVILLHSSGEFAALWSRVIPDLVTTHRVVAPDLPGHGASMRVDGELEPGRVLRWLGELIDRTCASPPVLVGHGLGGAIAAQFAADHGDRVDRLVLVDSLGLGPFEPAPSFGTAMHEFLREPTEQTRDGLFRQCFVDLDRVRAQVGELWEPVAAYALDRARTAGQQSALGALVAEFGGPADLARISVPTTMIWGRHDLQVPLSVAEKAAHRLGWPLHIIEDAGDDPAIEQPAAFTAALRTALSVSNEPLPERPESAARSR